MNQQTIDYIRIGSNILLSILLAITLFTVFSYKQDVQEALGLSEPARLVNLYEETTGNKCLCADPDFGNVTYVPKYQPYNPNINFTQAISEIP